LRVCYVKEGDVEISCYLYRLFNVVHAQTINEKEIYTLPICTKGDADISSYRIKRAAKKLVKKLKANQIKSVALSEDLSKIELLKSKLDSNGINILDGRILFNYLVYDALKYIADIGGKEIKDMEVSILANVSTDAAMEKIKALAEKVKTLNIITNNIQKFKRIESIFYNEMGILIKVSNNKNKALLRTDIIVNLDFSSDLINKYKLPDSCIILNINDNIIIKSKKFNGISVNDYEIKMPTEYKMYGFKDNVVYEEMLCREGLQFEKNNPGNKRCENNKINWK